MGRVGVWAAVFGLFLLGSEAGAQQTRELRVAAAADMAPMMPVLAQEYQKKTGVKVVVTVGSSSALVTQIVHGAPVDVFLGADFVFPEKVIAAGLAEEKLPVRYAKGTLVLWAKKEFGAPLSMELLTDKRLSRVAVADEFRAPYGRAAYAAMRWLKTLEGLKPKLVVAENDLEASQLVESGKAQVGLISLTLANSDRLKGEGQYVRVPAIYPEIIQCAVVMKASRHKEEGLDFLEWLRSSAVQENLGKFGLEAVR